MKSDIPILKVKDLAVAISPREEPSGEDDLWEVYLLNLKEEPIKDILVSSRGYGEVDGEMRRTSQFRFDFEKIAPLSYIILEHIQSRLFDFTNEYWISFVHGGYMYDKKYVFVKGSIDQSNFTTIPFLGRKGVMIK